MKVTVQFDIGEVVTFNHFDEAHAMVDTAFRNIMLSEKRKEIYDSFGEQLNIPTNK